MSVVSLECYSTLLLRQSNPPGQRSCLSESVVIKSLLFEGGLRNKSLNGLKI